MPLFGVKGVNKRIKYTYVRAASQAQRARTMLVKEVMDLMQAAGIDAFIGNTSEELALANLASLPTLVSPEATSVLNMWTWTDAGYLISLIFTSCHCY